MYAIGLMSGTSLDGIDSVLVKIKGVGINTRINLIEFITYDIPNDIKKEIKACCLEKSSSVDLICSLNFKLGYLFAKAVKEICNKANIDLKDIDFISSHGQTIYHLPKERENLIKSTFQIGEPAVIAYETNIKVISNFRVMDMAAGGEGAPLVPFSEHILYGSDNQNIALQNIGGIGNVTILPKCKDINKIFAFDTGPGNMIIDEVVQRLFNIKYDSCGEIASKGKVNIDILNSLMNHPYILAPIPKTTGREDFGEQFVKDLLDKCKNIKNEDIVATVTMFTAKSISENYKRYILDKVNLDKIIISGGGSHNKTLLSYLKQQLPQINIITQEELGFSSDAKEAIAFVILGNETLNNNYSNIPCATGAKEKVILGNITLSPRKESNV